MNDAHRLSLGIIGTAAGWTLEAVGPMFSTLASAATVAFLSVCIAEKFGLLDRFKRRK